MGDTLFQRCFIRSMIFLRMVIVSVFVFTPATNDHHFHVKWTSNPKVAANPSHGTVVISMIDGKGTDMRESQACIPCLIRSSVATVVIQTSRLATSDLDFQRPLVYPPNLIAYHLHLPIVFTKSSDQRFSFCIIPILLNRDGCPYLGFVSGVISHRRYLRSKTDEVSPHHLYGDVIWVFDPGISKLPVSLEGLGFRRHRIGLRLPMTWPADDVLTFYRWLIRLVFMKGEGMVTNRQRRVLHFQQHDHEPFQATSQCFSLIKVMRKASRSFIYKMLAFYEYMKRGLNRFYLLLVSLPFGKQGYFGHFFIEIVFNFLYLFHRLYLNGSMYHVNSYN